MALEIERKFLVKNPPEGFQYMDNERIRQGYTEAGRIREITKGNKARYFVTVKKGKGMVREEEENEVGIEVFEKMWDESGGKTIEKTRYLIPISGTSLKAELDVYGGRCSGLMTCEVEFPDEGAAMAFKPLEWFGREVTDDERYSNRYLSEFGISNVN
jgi:CYTH domain-containing protein